MIREFRLPDVGEGIHEAEIVRWLIKEGQQVQEFEPMVEVQTDKALVELPAPTTGYVSEIVKPAGVVAHVGEVVVRFAAEAAERGIESGRENVVAASNSIDIAVQHQRTTVTSSPTQIVDVPSGEMTRRPLATPGVRYYARQKGAPLERITGSGSRGRIRKQDVDGWLQAQEMVGIHVPSDMNITQPVSQGTRIPFRGLRRATAEHVKKSAFTAPHVTAFDDTDATELVALRRRWNESLESTGQRISYLPFLIKALVSALRAFPYFNARLCEDTEEIELLQDIHIGIAVDTPEGLLVPVIRHANQKTILELAHEIQRLSEGAKNRTLKSADLRGSTFTITNTGPIGGLFATPILNYPEVGILAVHKIQRKAVVIGDDIKIRDVLTLSLSFDHRVIDGATSVRFMNHMKNLIEHPDTLMLELR